MRLLIGADIGTQGVKVVLYSENGDCLSEAFESSKLHRPREGVVEEDPDFQYAMVLSLIGDCLRKSGADASAVAAISIVGQMAGVIGVDSSGRAVTPYDSWLDTRCGKYAIEMQNVAGDEVLAKTGCSPSFNHGPKKLWWKAERPDVYKTIRSFVQPGGYVAMRLCELAGKDAFIDSTYLHFSGFADNQSLAWNDDLCRKFDFDESKLPRIVEPNEIVGRLTKAVADECQLLEGTPVVAGCGDTVASFLACGATMPGTCIDVAGTASVFGATTDTFVADLNHQTLGCCRSAVPGLWHPYAYINGGGQNLVWFRDEVAGGETSFEELSSLAGDASKDEELPFFVPHLAGRVMPRASSLRGSWANLSWNTNSNLMFRAMLESVALEYLGYRNILRELVPDWVSSEIRVTGGGEKSPAWNQLKADRLQSPVVGIERSGGAPMGAVLMAGHGVGLFPDLDATVSEWIALGNVFEPDPSKASLSLTRTQKYNALVESLVRWSEQS